MYIRYSHSRYIFEPFLYVTSDMEKVLILAVLVGVVTSDTDYDPALFDEIVAQDSTKHQYIGVKEGDNWCWHHNQWEDVWINRPNPRRKETALEENSE